VTGYCGPTAITVGFSTTNKLISRFIRWVTRSPVSHAFVIFNTPTFGRVVMQAEAWGYEIRPWGLWQQQNALVAEFTPTGPDLAPSIVELAPQYLGRKYDWKAALLAGLWRWFGRWLRGRFNSPYSLMCSEALLRILQHAGYSSVAHFDAEVTSPRRVLDRVFEMALLYANEFQVKFALPAVRQQYTRRLTG
jgi:hypothetical protein